MTDILFISDLHLAPERPEIIELYLKFLDDKAAAARQLYILGDFVEYWLGDDDEAAGLQPVFAKMLQLSQQGLQIFLMHGNRDFLMGAQLAQRCGCQLLDDPSLVNFDATQVLLMHGDTLCTDDVDYQKLRVMLRDPQWQAEFLAKPLAERMLMAKALREKSEQETQKKSPEIMDVNGDAVAQAYKQHAVMLMIHGHTHRPDVHHINIDDTRVTRIVLGDWYTKGSYLAFNSVSDYALLNYP